MINVFNKSLVNSVVFRAYNKLGKIKLSFHIFYREEVRFFPERILKTSVISTNLPSG